MVGPEGFEPSTNGLKGRCSTAELQARPGKDTPDGAGNLME